MCLHCFLVDIGLSDDWGLICIGVELEGNQCRGFSSTGKVIV